MPVRYFYCKKCEEEFRTLKKEPKCPNKCKVELKFIIKAPHAKFMEKINPEKGISRVKDSNKILKERARNHSRDNEILDLVQMNDEKTAIDNKWLVEESDGTLVKRRKIHDI